MANPETPEVPQPLRLNDDPQYGLIALATLVRAIQEHPDSSHPYTKIEGSRTMVMLQAALLLQDRTVVLHGADGEPEQEFILVGVSPEVSLPDGTERQGTASFIRKSLHEEAMRHLQTYIHTVSGSSSRFTELSVRGSYLAYVPDFSPLADSLPSIDLSGTQISDLRPLACFERKSLFRLNLMNTNVIDLEPLSNLNSLLNLDLTGTRVTDIAPLANLTALEGLSIADTDVQDLSPLHNLTNLTLLDIMNTDTITSIEPLSGMASLELLRFSRLDDMDIEEIIRVLRSMPNLDEVEIDMEDLSGISGEEVAYISQQLPDVLVYQSDDPFDEEEDLYPPIELSPEEQENLRAGLADEDQPPSDELADLVRRANRPAGTNEEEE